MSSIQFVMCEEHNHKENETFLFYMQWTGNEDAITLLHQAITKSDVSEMYGDYSSFRMDLTKITEDAVDQLCKLKSSNGYHAMHTKCTGAFTSPITEEDMVEKQK